MRGAEKSTSCVSIQQDVFRTSVAGRDISGARPRPLKRTRRQWQPSLVGEIRLTFASQRKKSAPKKQTVMPTVRPCRACEGS